MKAIKTIAEDIREELDGAKHYAKLATQYKDSDRVLSEAYYNMAIQELSHVDALHSQAVRLIKVEQSAGREVPPGMQAVWDWEHSHMVDSMAKIKMLLELRK